LILGPRREKHSKSVSSGEPLFGVSRTRTPEERRRENQELLLLLPALLKPEVFQRLLELVGVDDHWQPTLKAALDCETYLDVIEAIVTIQHDAKAGLP
jgi:hypothetical protein